MIKGQSMQVPNALEAFVPPAKLYAYRLSEEHREGGPTIWIVPLGDPRPRLVTAYPICESQGA